MKLIWLFIIAVIGLFGTTACEEPVETALTEAEITQHVLDRISKNEGISYPLFQEMTERIPGDSLTDLRSLAAEKDEFLSTVANQSEDIFFEVVEQQIADFEITSIPTPFAAEAEITLKGLTSRSDFTKPADLPNQYSSVLVKLLEAQSGGEDHRQWIVVDAADNGETAGDSKPTETLSLNYEKIHFLVTEIHPIILDMNLTDGEVWIAVGDITNAHGIDPVTVALLLPAVQKIREAALNEEEPFSSALNTWLDGPVGEAINGGLNRDIIRRIQATVYLAGLHAIMTEEFNSSNVDNASLGVLHARYRAALLVGTETVWGK